MQQHQVSDESDNNPTPFRLQHPPEKPHCIYDEAYKLGIIDAGQHSDMAHWVMMRDAFRNRNTPRSSAIGKMMNAELGADIFTGESLADKYMWFIKEVPVVTRETLEAMTAPHSNQYVRGYYHKARDIMQCHLAILRKWLDNN